jgi:YVTN family beta-propeller protein
MTVRYLAAALAAALVANSGTADAQTTPSPALLVLAKSDQTLAIVEPASLKVITRLPAGPDPHEVITSADGRYAYISNYGGGAYNTLTVIDLVAQKALPPVDLGALRGPHGLAFEGGKVWFTAEAAKAIGSYDPMSKTIDWVLGTGQNRTHMLTVSKDLQRIVTANTASGSVSVIDRRSTDSRPPAGGPVSGAAAGSGQGASPAGAAPSRAAGAPQIDWDQTVIPTGRGAEGFDASPDGKTIWVANAADGTVSIIDADSKKVVETLAANVVGANRLKFTTDGTLVFISSLRAPDVAVFEAATHRERTRIPVGRGAAGILMQPDGTRVYIACSPDNSVAVIDLKSLAVVGRIEPGRNPDGLAWAARRD